MRDDTNLAEVSTLRERSLAFVKLSDAFLDMSIAFESGDRSIRAKYLKRAKWALKKSEYMRNVADGLEDLKVACDAFEKEHGPDAKLTAMP